MAKSSSSKKTSTPTKRNSQNVEASIVLSLNDVKIIAEKIGVPYLQLLFVMLNVDQNFNNANFLGPGHPRLLSVVPSNIQTLIKKRSKKI